MKDKQRRLIALLAVALLVLAATSYALARAPAVNPAGGADDSKVVMRVIAQGAALHGTNGINFGPDGNLYIASVPGREIVVMNPQNGKIIKRFGPADGVDGPDDLVFGPDGSLYWTEIMLGYVGRMTPEGIVTKQFVAMGVNPITFSPDGRLFVGLCFLGDGLYELDPDLIAPPRPIIEATPANPYPLGFLNGFSFGPDGRLYGPIFSGGIVVSVDVGSPGDSPSLEPWTDGTVQIVATGFKTPAAVKFDAHGRLHVVDGGTGEVIQVEIGTGAKTVVSRLDPGLDNLAFDSGGNLYVSNFENGSITRVLPSGQGRTLSEGGMVFAGGVAVLHGSDGRDKVFVASTFTLEEFNGLTGKRVSVTSGHLVGEGVLTTPLTVSADGDHLIVSSWFGHAVQVWDPQAGQLLAHYAMPAPLNAIRFKNDIVVADPVVGGVFWLSDGEMILPIDGENVFLPAGLVTDGERLWVADWATGIVWEIGFDGKIAHAPVAIAFGLIEPEGLAMDVDGSLLVVEAGAGRLSRIDLATREVSIVVSGLEIGMEGPSTAPPTWAFNGVAVGPSGAIYITGDVNNSLYRIWPR